MSNEEFIKSVSLEGEEWKAINGFEGLYAISSLGRVISLLKKVNNRFADVVKPPKLMKISFNNDSSPSVILSHNRKSIKRHLALLVAEHFIPKPDDSYTFVRYIDGYSHNNNISNIEWRKPKARQRKKNTIDFIDGEIWKPIQEFEDNYEISSYGRVKSLYYNKILEPFLGGEGKYLYILLVSGAKRKKTAVHRLVAQSFCCNPENFNEIDHIDGNKYNNHYSNLRWCNHKTNMNNEVTKNKLREASKGMFNERNAKSRKIVQIKDNEVICIFPSITEAGRKGYDRSSIHKCLKGEYKQYKSFIWLYYEDYKTLINMSKNSNLTQ